MLFLGISWKSSEDREGSIRLWYLAIWRNINSIACDFNAQLSRTLLCIQLFLISPLDVCQTLVVLEITLRLSTAKGTFCCLTLSLFRCGKISLISSPCLLVLFASFNRSTLWCHHQWNDSYTNNFIYWEYKKVFRLIVGYQAEKEVLLFSS